MYEMAGVEVIARGVCIKEGHILLCHAKHSELTYLPGGHIEFHETARTALVRELKEELAATAVAGEFLGCCEHTFMQKGERHCEINLVFEMQLPEVAVQPLEAAESWIGFKWVPVAKLSESHLEPAVLIEKLPQWLGDERIAPGHCDSGYGDV